MVKCKYCGKVIGDVTDYCPMCGAPVPKEKPPEPPPVQQVIVQHIAPPPVPPQKWYNNKILWVAGVIVLFFVLIVIDEILHHSPPARPSGTEQASGAEAAERLPRPETVYDLEGLNLLDHDLSGSEILESITLCALSFSAVGPAVTIIGGGALDETPLRLSNWTYGIALIYYVNHAETTAEAVDWMLGHIEATAAPNTITVHSIRASADNQTAVIQTYGECRAGLQRIWVSLMQAVPDSGEVVILELILTPSMWTAFSSTVLTELSDYFGIDLWAYADGLPRVDAAQDPASRFAREVVYDIDSLNLFDHDLGEGTALRQITLCGLSFYETGPTVSIIEEGRLYESFHNIANRVHAMSLYYRIRQFDTIYDALEWRIETPCCPGREPEVYSIRVSNDGQGAVLVKKGEGAHGAQVWLYVMQMTPGSDEVVELAMLFGPQHWVVRNHVVLAELSEHIGVDLSVYAQT